MPQHAPRSFRHEYELFVETEIENYKESIPRSALLKIGDEAVTAIRSMEQFAMDELLLCEEVDRIIRQRLRVPAYASWRRKRVKALEEYRRPEHWGLRPDCILAREVHPPAESCVLVAGGGVESAALYLAAHGCDVTALDTEAAALDRVMAAAQAAGLTDRIDGHATGLDQWQPESLLSAVVCSPSAFAGLSAEERARAIDLLKTATRDGGVHLVGTIVSGKRGISLTELKKQYRGWTISVEDDSTTSKSFLAKKVTI
ncbi:MAG: hypothetical protein H0W63_11065 [Gemmatimonadaceae bacterium]|nr:hypothetical protein [Gemmatimonadaceae bacterium]